MSEDFKFLVPRAGIEPAHPKVQDFESSASTSSATEAFAYLDFLINKISECKVKVFIEIYKREHKRKYYI